MKNQSDLLLSVAIPRPLDGAFTYRISKELAEKVKVGGWVRVPFGRSKTHAYVLEEPKTFDQLALPKGMNESALKDVIEVGDSDLRISEDVLELCKWTSRYYRAPLGEVLQAAAPAAALGLRSRKSEAREIQHDQEILPVEFSLNEDQRKALELLDAARLEAEQTKKRTALLLGVTGSGKTEVYLDLAKRVLAEGRGVIVLVPEIALTPQLHHRFQSRLGEPVALWHSAVADGKRRDQWAALRKGKVRVVVGARSAVFAPVQNLGLIIVDEEHEPTYKQEDRVRYHARDLSIVRAGFSNAYVVLGSATPSLETREKAKRGQILLTELPKRAVVGGSLPAIDVVDLTKEPLLPDSQATIAVRTAEAIRDTIAEGGQVMVFLNRRGFAAFLVCQDCGHVPGCPSCSISLTVHKKRGLLRCHVCGFETKPPDVCSDCESGDLLPVGAGTESLEEQLPEWIPSIIPLRLDRDVITSVKRLEQVLDDFRAGKANTLLGTQMLVKGHDFPNVTLVVVILADSLFRWPDFRAPERAYQILTQVAGRAGRGEKPGRVLIQTFQPEHEVIQAIEGKISEEDFLANEAELRDALGYPPFGRIARIRIERAVKEEARCLAQELADGLEKFSTEKEEGNLEVLGPSEAFLERARGIYRWDLLLKSKDVGSLQRALGFARFYDQDKKRPLLIDVDPIGTG